VYFEPRDGFKKSPAIGMEKPESGQNNEASGQARLSTDSRPFKKHQRPLTSAVRQNVERLRYQSKDDRVMCVAPIVRSA
jgi:hypothetical protein